MHSWCVPLDVPAETAGLLHATLSDEERQRGARFRFERDRQRFAVARAVLRELVARYLGKAPADLRFVHNAFGKPALAPEFGSGLRFNVSHSADLALIAIAAGADLGVDLEYIQAHADYTDIARRFFSAAEVLDLCGLPGDLQPQAFFSCWTKKEAYLKACGEGLASIDAASNGAVPAPARHWSLYTLEPAPGYVGAVAVEGSGWQVRQWHWQASDSHSRC